MPWEPAGSLQPTARVQTDVRHWGVYDEERMQTTLMLQTQGALLVFDEPEPKAGTGFKVNENTETK